MGSAAAAVLARLHFDYRATSTKALLAERRSRCPPGAGVSPLLLRCSILIYVMAQWLVTCAFDLLGLDKNANK